MKAIITCVVVLMLGIALLELFKKYEVTVGHPGFSSSLNTNGNLRWIISRASKA